LDWGDMQHVLGRYGSGYETTLGRYEMNLGRYEQFVNDLGTSWGVQKLGLYKIGA